MSRHRKLIKNTFVLFLGKLLTQFLSFFMLPIYTRELSTADYGAVDLILTYISLLIPVITIEQSMATFRYLVDARGNKAKQAEIISVSMMSVFVRLSIFAIVYVVLSIFIHFEYIHLVLLVGLIMAFSQLLLQVARGFGDNLKYTIGSVLSGIVTIISNLFLILVLKIGAESILISMGIANLCCFVYLFLALDIPYYMSVKGQTKNKRLRRDMLKYSWPLVPNGVSWWLINASDRTIISIFLGTAENGIYAVANKFPSIVSSFISVFSLSWTESAAVHINDDDRDIFFSEVAGNSLRLFSSLGMLVIAVMPFVFDIIIGPEYRAAYNYIPIAVFAVFLNSMVLIYSAVYVAKKVTKKVAMTSIASALINIVVDLILIKFVGLYAAVISTAVAYLVMVIYRHYDVKEIVRIRYSLLDLVMVVLGFVGISVTYYMDNWMCHIVGLILVMILAVIQNRNMIYTTLRKICAIIKRRNINK